MDKATKGPRLNCRNWECGVIIPILVKPRDSEKEERTHGVDSGLAKFADYVPIPMRYPGDVMENKKPWAGFAG